MAKLLTKDTGVDILLTELRQEDSGKSTTAKSLPFVQDYIMLNKSYV